MTKVCDMGPNELKLRQRIIDEGIVQVSGWKRRNDPNIEHLGEYLVQKAKYDQEMLNDN